MINIFETPIVPLIQYKWQNVRWFSHCKKVNALNIFFLNSYEWNMCMKPKQCTSKYSFRIFRRVISSILLSLPTHRKTYLWCRSRFNNIIYVHNNERWGWWYEKWGKRKKRWKLCWSVHFMNAMPAWLLNMQIFMS